MGRLSNKFPAIPPRCVNMYRTAVSLGFRFQPILEFDQKMAILVTSPDDIPQMSIGNEKRLPDAAPAALLSVKMRKMEVIFVG